MDLASSGPIAPEITVRGFADACWWLLQALREEEIFEALTNSARELSGADCVYFAGREDGQLRVMASSGLHNPDMVRSWRVPVGAGVSGQVVSRGVPAVVRDYVHDPRRIHLVKSIVDAEGLRSALVLPLCRLDEVIGALCVAHRSLVDPDDWPTRALELLVRQAASQLDHASAVERERTARRDAEWAAAESDRAVELVDLVARTLMTEKRTGPALAHIVGCLGGHCVLAGGDGGVLAHAESGSAELPVLQAEIELEDAATTLGHLRFFRQLALRPIEKRALEQCASVIALELLAERAGLETERRLGRHLMQELLGGDIADETGLRYRASLLGIDLATPRAVLRFTAHAGRGTRPGAGLHDHDLWTLEQRARNRCPGAVGWMAGPDVVLVVDVAERSERDVRQLAVQLLNETAPSTETARATGTALAAGAGRVCTTIDDYARAAVEAEMAAEIACVRPSPRQVVVRDQLGICGLLGPSTDPRELIAMATRVLEPLLAADENTGSAYIRTLRTFHACDRRLAESAKALHVHVNTLKYRLRKIEELLGLDLSDVDTRFMLELTLRVHETLSGAAGTDDDRHRHHIITADHGSMLLLVSGGGDQDPGEECPVRLSALSLAPVFENGFKGLQEAFQRGVLPFPPSSSGQVGAHLRDDPPRVLA